MPGRVLEEVAKALWEEVAVVKALLEAVAKALFLV